MAFGHTPNLDFLKSSVKVGCHRFHRFGLWKAVEKWSWWVRGSSESNQPIARGISDRNKGRALERGLWFLEGAIAALSRGFG